MTGGPGRDRAASFAAVLESAGDLPAECAPAFRAVAREWFIPDRVWIQELDGGPYEPVDRAAEPERWLKGVYSDRVVVTQFDDAATRWPRVGYRPTCSASMPSAVAGMLAALDVRQGQSVLEIGTGTGYNAALLAELTGPHGKVWTVEVDEAIATAARERLTASGYGHVCTRIEDAVATTIAGEFDRVIATAGVHVGRLPHAWVDRVRAGGLILAPMRTDLASGPLVRFTVDGGVARGQATTMRVGFMELRSHRVATLETTGLRWDDNTAEQSSSDVSPFGALLDEASRWAIAVAVPSCRYHLEKKQPGRSHGVAWLTDPISGSWASIVPAAGRYTARQSGPRRLWTEAVAAYRWWQHNGEPAVEEWRWTVTADRQSVTLASVA